MPSKHEMLGYFNKTASFIWERIRETKRQREGKRDKQQRLRKKLGNRKWKHRAADNPQLSLYTAMFLLHAYMQLTVTGVSYTNNLNPFELKQEAISGYTTFRIRQLSLCVLGGPQAHFYSGLKKEHKDPSTPLFLWCIMPQQQAASLCIIRIGHRETAEIRLLHSRCRPLDLTVEERLITSNPPIRKPLITGKRAGSGSFIRPEPRLSYGNSEGSNLSGKHTCCICRNRWHSRLYPNCRCSLSLYYTQQKHTS